MLITGLDFDIIQYCWFFVFLLIYGAANCFFTLMTGFKVYPRVNWDFESFLFWAILMSLIAFPLFGFLAARFLQCSTKYCIRNHQTQSLLQVVNSRHKSQCFNTTFHSSINPPIVPSLDKSTEYFWAYLHWQSRMRLNKFFATIFCKKQVFHTIQCTCCAIYVHAACSFFDCIRACNRLSSFPLTHRRRFVCLPPISFLESTKIVRMDKLWRAIQIWWVCVIHEGIF